MTYPSVSRLPSDARESTNRLGTLETSFPSIDKISRLLLKSSNAIYWPGGKFGMFGNTTGVVVYVSVGLSCIGVKVKEDVAETGKLDAVGRTICVLVGSIEGNPEE